MKLGRTKSLTVEVASSDRGCEPPEPLTQPGGADGALIRQKSAASSSRIVRFLNALSLALSCAMLMLVMFGLWQAREDAWKASEVASSNLVTALSRNVGNNVRLVDQAVIATSIGLELPGLWKYPEDVRNLVLFNKARWSPYLSRVFVTNERGRIIALSDGARGVGVDLSGRSYFRLLRSSGSRKPLLSSVVISRIGREPSLILARRIATSDGRFAGIVAGEMPLRLIRPTLDDVVIGSRSAINLFNLDGTILLRNPALKPGAAGNIGGAPTFERMKREMTGVFVGRSAVDNEQRLYVFARPAGLPLLLDVATSTSEILAPWWKRSLPVILTTLALCAGIIVLASLFQRELLRREKLEAELAELASTDGLTGLLNRRSFDAGLARELRRAERTKQPLSLAIIDADHFKAFNDTYGHVAGDKTLQSIADAMREVYRRPADQIARIGGEEFAVLMPDTPQNGALARAEALRYAVAGLGIAHSGNSEGVVTVSVGVTSMMENDADPTVIMRLADQALYEAKGRGRNCVSSFHGET
ncbi:diguanylate cyclase (GGDEF)-like protein [Sphingomonas sp. PP-CE-3A-406]|nr:diguanylate cyclase (GGDEF)-like protein [Sphingomonas sp. PP-CE-3A-406]